MLHTDHEGYLNRQVVILVMPILQLIDIRERLVIQIPLVKQGHRHITGLDITRHTALGTYTDVEQEARRAIRTSGLQLVQETCTSGYTETRAIITLRWK